MTNQLRLVEKELERLTAHETIDDGLPTPELFGLVTVLAYARWLRGPQIPARRAQGNDYFERQGEIFQSWKDAGFELSPKPSPANHAALETWVERQRVELIRCLDAQTLAEKEHETTAP